MAENNVLVSILSCQSFDGVGEEQVEQQFPGRLLPRGDGWVLSYRDRDPGGREGTLTILRLEREQVLLQRTGVINAQMRFRVGERHRSQYDTPYGAIPLEIITRRLDVDVSGAGGTIEIDYALDLGGQAGSNRFQLMIRPL